MLIIDQYAYQNRLVGLSPKVKLGIYLLLLGISFTGIPSLQWAIIVALFPATCYVAKLHWKTYAKWLLLTLPFVLISLVTMAVSFQTSPSQDVLLTLPLWKGYAVISQASLVQTLEVFVRSYACLMSTYFFVLTVPFRQLIDLLRSFRIPNELLEVIVFMYRFIFMFLEEFLVMRDTLDLKFGFGTMKQSYQTMGLLASQLFTRLMRANRQINDMLEFRFDR
ncbi:cobalt ECF transporter T component CbiQ [Streptococcus suis]|uniref:cobalt ECF transporter T component CbiQ n=1 Tax=Streptococcus suis TaxID=1307 RepID=UPI000CF49A60|nr:cobalt ECF transporter T component CbiQ [Streptococcus suis]HEM5997296.1 cobalt ECF transporter T component CbiQ [Streptococcus suis]HEM6346196.1 cobalt ECF transporter T component CbiQ [Streptococcus suis]HEM6372149.1 cobalt ECF transporter T component CbiQ [Streptococcus suis]